MSIHSGIIVNAGCRNIKGVSSEYVDVVGGKVLGGECSFKGDKAMTETEVNAMANRAARRMTSELGNSLQAVGQLDDAES